MKHFKLEYKPFPEIIRGQVFGFTSEVEGKYIVLIDSTRDAQTQKKTLRHELAHLMLGHTDNQDADLEALEADADAIAEHMTEAELEALLAWAI